MEDPNNPKTRLTDYLAKLEKYISSLKGEAAKVALAAFAALVGHESLPTTQFLSKLSAIANTVSHRSVEDAIEAGSNELVRRKASNWGPRHFVAALREHVPSLKLPTTTPPLDEGDDGFIEASSEEQTSA